LSICHGQTESMWGGGFPSYVDVNINVVYMMFHGKQPTTCMQCIYMLCASCKSVQIIMCMKLENANNNLYKISLDITCNLYNFLPVCNCSERRNS